MRFKVEFIRTAFEPIGKVAEFEVDTVDVLDALREAWAKYNRGSGFEVSFVGPSASVDDIFRVSWPGGHPGIYELHVVAPVGFKRVDRYAPAGSRCASCHEAAVTQTGAVCSACAGGVL